MTPQIYQFGKEGQDQRLYHDDTGVYVFDWSGDKPTTTDDGPLRVDSGSVCTLSVWSGGIEVVVPVVSVRRGELARCSMSIGCFDQLRRLVKGLTLKSGERYSVLAAKVLKAEVIRMELEAGQAALAPPR